MIAGGCFCGQVRFETDAAPYNETVCHCVDCRKAVGAASVAWLTVPRAAVRWPGADPASFASSPGVTRRFCRTCGTSLTWEDDAKDELDLAAAALDDPAAITPRDHVWASQRVPWDRIADSLPVFGRGRADG